MPRLLHGVAGLLSPAGAVTHEGAAAFDLRVGDPLVHLVFTKGATILGKTYYRTQAEEIRSYASALIAAERAEPGFAWRFAAYMRDPKRGKGNRVQGSVAPAILAAAAPDSPFVEDYVHRCLQHRADDVTAFVAHGKNLGLPLPSDAARRGMARALAGFDDYQILKYATKSLPLVERRRSTDGSLGPRKSLRLVDAMGLCKAHLDARTTKLYEYLHASTRDRDALATGIPMLESRRRFFRGHGDSNDFAAGRLTLEQARSVLGNTAQTWSRLLDVPGLVGDLALLRNLRSMAIAGFAVGDLVDEVQRRRFAGVWPHQVYAGYRAMVNGSTQLGRWTHRPAFSAPAMLELVPVFDAVLDRIARDVMPPTPSLGLADVSGSMFGAPVGGEQSSLFVGDVSCLFTALMAKSLGYGATFSDDVHLVGCGGRSPMRMADDLRRGPGMGGTQVAGAVRHLLATLLAEPERPRPRTLFFFSDMQFHPPAQMTFAPNWGGGRVDPAVTQVLGRLPPLDPSQPPMLALLKLWRELLGPIDVVLWNLAAYDNSPVPSGMDHVLLLSGFDANSFKHVQTWQSEGSAGGTPRASTATPTRDANVELDYIRTF